MHRQCGSRGVELRPKRVCHVYRGFRRRQLCGGRRELRLQIVHGIARGFEFRRERRRGAVRLLRTRRRLRDKLCARRRRRLGGGTARLGNLNIGGGGGGGGGGSLHR